MCPSFLARSWSCVDKGFDFYVFRNIPNGAGLSSSASLELLTSVVAEYLVTLKLDRLELGLKSRKIDRK